MNDHSLLVSSSAPRVSFFDVGKGDCILVQSGGTSILIDTGYDKTVDAVVSRLRLCGVQCIEHLILTHYDRDHVGGVGGIARAFKVGTVFLPGYVGSDKNYHTLTQTIEGLKLNARPTTGEQHIAFGEYTLSLYPSTVAYVPGSKGKEGNDNDMSLVAAFSGNGHSYLFAGDMEKEGIEAYLKRALGRFDVVKMPCHGRRFSSTDEFIGDTRPGIAVITDSEDEPADKKTLKQLKEAGAEVYRTSVHGTIVVQAEKAGCYSVSVTT